MSINISKRVIELLESEKGKSQNDLALEIGLAPSVISKIKTGRSRDPSAETVAALAKYFNVSADWILGLTDVKDKIHKEIQKKNVGMSQDTSEVAKQARRDYENKWRRENKEKVREYKRRYWEKKAREMLEGDKKDV